VEFSERELKVLRLLARGLFTGEIAGRLHPPEGILRSYVSTILTKPEITDRTKTAALAIRNGYGQPEFKNPNMV